MAKVKNLDSFQRQGKLNKKSKEVHRIRNGREYIHTIENPYEGPASKAQKAHRSLFGKTNSIVNAIMADPAQVQEWKARMDEHNRSVTLYLPPFPKRYKTVRSYAYFVVSEQLKQTPAAKRRRAKLPITLPKGYKLQIKSFPELSAAEIYEILKARFIVFVGEQHIHYTDEDNIDYLATHFSIRKNGLVLAYARLFPSADKDVLTIGRMLTVERGKGLAKYIMQQIVSYAKNEGAHTLRLHAQMHAVAFYEKLGFHTAGDTFTEAEIPHIHMEMQL